MLCADMIDRIFLFLAHIVTTFPCAVEWFDVEMGEPMEVETAFKIELLATVGKIAGQDGSVRCHLVLVHFVPIGENLVMLTVLNSAGESTRPVVLEDMLIQSGVSGCVGWAVRTRPGGDVVVVESDMIA